MKQNSFLCSLLTMMMVAMLSIGFAACSDDDDDKGSGSSIVGTWSGSDGDGGYLTLTFKKGGTGTWASKYYEPGYGTETDNGTFFYEQTNGSGGYITVRFGDETELYYYEIKGQKMYVYYIYDDETFLELVLTKK